MDLSVSTCPSCMSWLGHHGSWTISDVSFHGSPVIVPKQYRLDHSRHYCSTNVFFKEDWRRAGLGLKLGRKYSHLLDGSFQNQEGKNDIYTMGCYGIGVGRTVAAAIEQNHDKYGIKWPKAIAPFDVAIVPMNMHKSQRVQETAQNIYQQLQSSNMDVLFDDRKERPGVMLNDMELIGIPQLIIIGERSLDRGVVEIKDRHTGEKTEVTLDNLLSHLQN